MAAPLPAGLPGAPRVAGVPRAASVHEAAADRLLHAPGVDDAGWAAFRSGPGGLLPLGEELAVAVTQRALAHEAELRVLQWVQFLLQDCAYDADGDGAGAGLGGGVPGAAAAAAEARAWGVRLARTLLTRVRWAEPTPGLPGGLPGGAGRDAAAAARRVAAALPPLLDAFARQLAAAARPEAIRREADRAVAGLTRALDAALALHADINGGAAARTPIAGVHAEPLAAQLWALMPTPEEAAAVAAAATAAAAAAATSGGSAAAASSALAAAARGEADGSAAAPIRAALHTVRLLNRLLLPHPDATSALVDAPAGLAKLRAWLGGGGAAAAVPQLRAAAVDLLCTLFKRAPGRVLHALQAADLGALAAAAAAPDASGMAAAAAASSAPGAALVPRVAALVAVGALRERAEFAPGAWWAHVAPPLRGCAEGILAALAQPEARKELLSHFHTSPGGPPARAAALRAAAAADDAPFTICAAARLLLATAPERLGGGAARVDRAALLAVPGLTQALLHLGTHPSDELLRRLGAALLGHVAAAQAAAGTPTLLSSLCTAQRATAAMAPTVTLRLLPEGAAEDAPDGSAGAPPALAVLPANRELLAARCPVFAAMFGNVRNVESSAPLVTLRGVAPRGMRALLEWAATGALRCADMDEALECLAVAERFMVVELVETLTSLVKGLVSENTVGALLRFADGAGREALCAWACEWAVAGAHAGALVRAGTLAGLPGGAAHTLMLAIASRADAATNAAPSAGAAAAAPSAGMVAGGAGSDGGSPPGGGGGLKRRRDDSHAAMLDLLAQPRSSGAD